MKTNKLLSVKNICMIAVLGALACILMLFQIPVPFAPAFYQIDFAVVPGLIGSFAMGPVAGVLIEAVKILLKIITQGSNTMYVGELGNFLAAVSFVLPAGLIYKKFHTRKGAYIALGVSTLIMVGWSIIGNVCISLPFYAKVMFDGLEPIIAMGTALNASITNLFTFVVYAIVPFNLLKGVLNCVVTAILYKRVSKLLKLEIKSKKAEA